MNLENNRMPTHMASHSDERGFTLIELMITVAVVGILATIAATSYTSQIQKSRRTDARSALLDLAGREEKLFSTTNAYSAAATDLGYTTFANPIGGGYYTIGVAVGNPPIIYTITATVAGAQVSDGQCQTLTIDQAGNQTSTGSAPATTCWGN
jgi:type IV pilus assembly protein PilE